MVCRHGRDALLKFKQSITTGEKGDLSDLDLKISEQQPTKGLVSVTESLVLMFTKMDLWKGCTMLFNECYIYI